MCSATRAKESERNVTSFFFYTLLHTSIKNKHTHKKNTI